MGGCVSDQIWKAINLIKLSSIGLSVCGVMMDDNAEGVENLEKRFRDEYIPFYCRRLLRVGRGKHCLFEQEGSANKTYGRPAFFALMPNGNIQVCGECGITLGNIFTDDIISVWSSKRSYFAYCRTKNVCLAEIESVPAMELME